MHPAVVALIGLTVLPLAAGVIVPLPLIGAQIGREEVLCLGIARVDPCCVGHLLELIA